MVDRGAWATATAYVVGDAVSYAGVRYASRSAHTSAAAFAADLAASRWVRLDAVDGSGGYVALGSWWRKILDARAGGASPKMLFLGDSTSLVGTGVGVDVYPYTASGEALEGLTASTSFVVAGGNNGFSLATWLGSTGSGTGGGNTFPADVISLAPDLIVASWGINDVRQGATDLAQMTALLLRFIDWRDQNIPETPLVLRMPNSFLTTDVGGSGYVVPNGSAQAYSTILRRAYLAVRDLRPNVPVIDMQSLIFGSTSRAASVFMSDQIHPGARGYESVVDEVVNVIGVPQLTTPRDPASTLKTRYAFAAGGTAPWAENPTVLDDPALYRVVLEGALTTLDAPNNRISVLGRPGDVASTLPLSGRLLGTDVVRLGNFIAQPGSITATANGNGVWVNGPAGWLTAAPTSGNVKVYRQIADDATTYIVGKFGRDSWRYVRAFRLIAGGSGTLAINASLFPGPAGADCYFDAADRIFVAGDTSAAGRTFTVATRNTGNGRLDLNVAGLDSTALVGRVAYIVGSHGEEFGLRRSVSVDPPSIAAGATADVTATVTGVDTSTVLGLGFSPPALTAGLVIGLVRVSAANTVTIRLYNSTAAPIDEPAGSWVFWQYR